MAPNGSRESKVVEVLIGLIVVEYEIWPDRHDPVCT